MKKNIIISLVIPFIISLLYTGCGCFGAVDSSIASNQLITEGNDIKTIVSGNSDFALALYGRLKEDPNAVALNGNLFFSPYSISSALAIIYGGARGQTQEQMGSALHFSLPGKSLHRVFGAMQKQLVHDDKSRGYQLFLANAVWGQKGEPFLKEFLDLTQYYYGAGFNQLDFINESEQSRNKINSWVEEKTNYKIKDLIPLGGVNRDTAMVLTNAIYFKGEWKTKFRWWRTKNADFTVSLNHKVEVPMMHLKKEFKYYDDANLQAIELPYKSDEISMLVILPKEIEGIKEIENTFTTESLNILLSKMRTCKVEVYFPKFKMIWGAFCLNNILKTLGISDAFDPQKADFSGITGKNDLWISDVFHKAFIEVNEKGTEAAASTGLVLTSSIEFEPPVFRADHPFIFIIKDNRSGSILFMGRLMNPVK